MNILFLTLGISDDINERGIYNDLMRKFRDEGHKVYIICPNERKLNKKSTISMFDGIKIIKMKWLNIQKCNTIEKGIATLLLDYLFLWGIIKYLREIKYDLLLYSTPPITFEKSIKYIKRKSKAKSYLLLKDIFPQNAVDIGLMRKNSFIYKYFRRKEIALYNLSDHIGCMSPANVQYVLEHNFLSPKKVEVNPNSLEPVSFNISEGNLNKIKKQYNIPLNSLVLLYGGNIGEPQGIDFLIQVLESNTNNDDFFFIIIGSGTKFNQLSNWITNKNPQNSILLEQLPKSEFDNFVMLADVGLIFLDKRFTIPNFPSRLLSYLENKKPVLLATDKVSDMGKIAEENKFGLWSQSGNLYNFNDNMCKLKGDIDLRKTMGEEGFNYFMNNFTVSHSYEKIISHLN